MLLNDDDKLRFLQLELGKYVKSCTLVSYFCRSETYEITKVLNVLISVFQLLNFVRFQLSHSSESISTAKDKESQME